MQSKPAQDRGQKDKGVLGRREFTQTLLSFDCQIIISLLNSWSVSIIIEGEYFPAATSSIFVKWADWTWSRWRKHQLGMTLLPFYLHTWQNSIDLWLHGKNVASSILNQDIKLILFPAVCLPSLKTQSNHLCLDTCKELFCTSVSVKLQWRRSLRAPATEMFTLEIPSSSVTLS